MHAYKPSLRTIHIINYELSNAEPKLSKPAIRAGSLDGQLPPTHSCRSTSSPAQSSLPPASALPSPATASATAFHPHAPSASDAHKQPSNRVTLFSFSAQMYNFPVQLSCPCCKMNVPTVVNQESGNTTYTWCAAIGCCISPLFCCLPFVMDSCLDKAHYCPNCGHNILRKHQRCFEFIGC